MGEKILYTKYSNDRREDFRIATQIIERDGKKIVRKSAMGKTARNHILLMKNHAKSLDEMFGNTKFKANRIISSGEDFVDFDFVDGSSFDKILDEFLQDEDFDGFYGGVNQFFTELEKFAVAEFRANEKTKEIFGEDAFAEGEKAIPVGNIDLIFQNVIVNSDEDWTVIDYEWTFDFALPLRFLKWRALFNFLSLERRRVNIDPNEVFGKFSLSGDSESFRRIETEKFFKFIRNGEFFSFTQDFPKEIVVPDVEIGNLKAHINLLLESERTLQAELGCKNAHIEQLLESERRLNAEVRSMDTALKSASEELERKKAHIELLLASERKLKKEVSDLKNSFSFKVTAPLRFAKKAARKAYRVLFPNKVREALRRFRH